MSDNTAVSNALNLLSLSLQSAANTLTLLQGILAPVHEAAPVQQQQRERPQQQHQQKGPSGKKGQLGVRDSSKEDAKQMERRNRPPPDQTIIVKRIPASMTDDDLRGHFSSLGQDAILSLTRPKNGAMCFVAFKTADLATRALSLAPPAKDGQKADVEAQKRLSHIKLTFVPASLSDQDIKQYYEGALGSKTIQRYDRPRHELSICIIGFNSPELTKAAFRLPAPTKDSKAPFVSLPTRESIGAPRLVLKDIPAQMTHLDILQHYESLGTDAITMFLRVSARLAFIAFRSDTLLKQAAAMAPPVKDGVAATVVDKSHKTSRTDGVKAAVEVEAKSSEGPRPTKKARRSA